MHGYWERRDEFNKNTTQATRWTMVILWAKGRSFRSIGRTLCCDHTTVIHWVNNFRATSAMLFFVFFSPAFDGFLPLNCCRVSIVCSHSYAESVVGNRGNCGRPLALSPSKRAAIVKALLAGRTVPDMMAKHKVSDKTISSIAAEEGLKYLSCVRVPPLTDRHKLLRLRFARRHLRLHTNWRRVPSPLTPHSHSHSHSHSSSHSPWFLTEIGTSPSALG